MKKVRVLRTITVSLLIGSFAACSTVGSYVGIGGEDGWLRDRQGEYLNAQITPRMQIPSELDSFTIDELYYIPDEPPGQRALYITPPAPKPIDTRIREGVVIQRFGDRAWIVIGATPGQVWPRLRDYWSTEQVPISNENPVAGTMETAWIAQGDSGERHKYQVWVEPGLHAGNSEVYVRHVNDQGESGANEPAQWPAVSDSLERETTILASISLYLADRTDIYRASSVSLLAGSIDIQGKARVVTPEAGDTRLELRLDYDRAWSQLTQAINNADIPVIATDREDRLIRLSFSGNENVSQPGFFGRMFRRGNNDAEEQIEFELRLIQSGDVISVRAQPSGGASAPYQQDLLIRTINDNLI
jgi:outer membrane protein assembly factor BamC